MVLREQNAVARTSLHDVRVFNNQIKSNNTLTFAAPGSTVSAIPAGTGSFVLAADRVEVFGNTFDGNRTVQFAVISYLVTQMTFPAEYYPYPTNIYIHDNTWTNGGTNPDATNTLGALLSTNLMLFTPPHVADVLWDGVPDPAKMIGPGPADPLNICLQNTNGATFADLHADPMMLDLVNGFTKLTQDVAPFTCTIPPLPEVTLPGM